MACINDLTIFNVNRNEAFSFTNDSKNTNNFEEPNTWWQAIQTWKPSFCLLVLIPLHLMFLMSRGDRKDTQIGFVTRLKVYTSSTLALLSMAHVAFNFNTEGVVLVESFLEGTMNSVGQAALFGMVAVLTMLERRRGGGTRSRLTLLTFWSVMLALATRTFYFQSLSIKFECLTDKEFLVDMSLLLGVFLAFSLSWLSDKPKSHDPRTSSESVNPEDEASWWSDLTLSWSYCLVLAGFKRNLEETDVPPLSPMDKCCNVVPALEREWKIEEFKCKLNVGNVKSLSGKQLANQDQDDGSLLNEFKETEEDQGDKDTKQTASLLKALLKAHGFKFFFFQCVKCGLEMTCFIEPLLTAVLMNHIQNRENESAWNGIFIVASMFVFKCFGEIAHHRIWHSINRLSRHMKNSVSLIIFKKSMTLKNECTKDKTNGEIVNLISDDCDRVFHMGQHIFFLLVAPVKVLFSLYLLYTYMGWSMLVGVIILILLIPLNSFIANKMKDLNNHRTEVKDKRVKLMSEIISGMKVLKLYAWEKSFMQKVDGIRSEETETCVEKSKYHAAIDSMFRAIPFLVKVGAIGTFLLLGGHMDATKGFVAVSLFSILNDPLSLVALLLPGYVEAHLSLKRINTFLNGENISGEVVKKVSNVASAVHVRSGRFSWEKSNPDPTLTNININIPKGGLVAVVGMVGSGKSSLISSMLGEMEKLDGEVQIQGRLAYVPQEAWIMNASLQDNVLFGSNMDKARYRQVVNGCCLKNDINIMTAGDRTEIGEKGINLSGGQKQRVSLARAVYNDADVYLLDDPLSAVDAHVGKRIFNKVISHQGILKEKTRVLVTHGIHWLPFVDSIIVMKDGQVSETGTYEQLISRKGAFAQFLNDLCSHSSENENQKINDFKQRVIQRLNSREESQKINFKIEKDEIKNLNKDSSSGESSDDECDNDSEDVDTNTSSGKLIDDEETEQGSVKKGVYIEYIKAFGIKYVLILTFLFLVTIVAENCQTYTIKVWTDDPLLSNASLSDSDEYVERSWYYFYSFAISGLFEVVAAFLFITLTLQGAFKAGKNLHDRLLDTILKCPMSFFDTTPSCRVVNRFSTDIQRVDALGHCLRGFIEQLLTLSTALILMVINAPVILTFVLPTCVLYYLLHLIHISTVRQLRRYKTKHRSPMYIHFSETLSGVSSIRAYACQRRFVRTMERKIEEFTKFDTTELAVCLWFGMRRSFLYLFVQMIAGIVVVLDTRMTAGMAGLVLIYASEFAGRLGGIVHLMTHMETEVISLERVLDYATKPTEAEWEISETKPAADWPSDGRVVINDYKVRYREGLDLVLKGVNCDIKRGEKIGIVGRTGAGKSSLTMALFRLIEASCGHIQVDNETIAELGLHDLRSKITILPQEPVIFAGTLRMNLDPFDKCTTEELWVALQHSHLKSFVEGLPNKLDFECGEGGKNLSVGQRQLLCLARTLLRQTKILVLDEATAAVDMETDELIQKTIRTEFRECTVLTIAHRLNTIMDYDRILVLDQGVVKEFDSPNNLLSDKQSTFYSMAKDEFTGIILSKQFISIPINFSTFKI